MGISTIDDNFNYKISGFQVNQPATLIVLVNTQSTEEPTFTFSDNIEIVYQYNYSGYGEGTKYKSLYFTPSTSDVTLSITYPTSSTKTFGGIINAYQTFISD